VAAKKVKKEMIFTKAIIISLSILNAFALNELIILFDLMNVN
jgi:hypothetical protein